MDGGELILPAGDFEKLQYAIAYGADAVYVGVPQFSLRARENRFTKETLQEAVNYCRAHNKKIYFTTNIYAHNAKIPAFLESFSWMYELHPDAFIMSDPGLIYLVKKQYPDAVIHLSVQANNTNWAQALFWREIGIHRIILSREITLEEIREIQEKVPGMEFEVFVHGAMCIAYSGRCLLSSYLSYRDANQGICSHSCRWAYNVYKEHPWNETKDSRASYENTSFYIEEQERKGERMEIIEDAHGTYIMNSRDLCALFFLEDLLKIGIRAFKVEGRNKTIYYIATVARVYRNALDALVKGIPYDFHQGMEELFSVANRGYIPGFLAGNPGKYAQEYEKNESFQTKVFLGIFRYFDEQKGLGYLEVKNRFVKGQRVEVITPDVTESFPITTILKVRDANSSLKQGYNISSNDIEEVMEAHGGGYHVWINVPRNYGPFALLRSVGM